MLVVSTTSIRHQHSQNDDQAMHRQHQRDRCAEGHDSLQDPTILYKRRTVCEFIVSKWHGFGEKKIFFFALTWENSECFRVFSHSWQAHLTEDESQTRWTNKCWDSTPALSTVPLTLSRISDDFWHAHGPSVHHELCWWCHSDGRLRQRDREINHKHRCSVVLV